MVSSVRITLRGGGDCGRDRQSGVSRDRRGPARHRAHTLVSEVGFYSLFLAFGAHFSALPLDRSRREEAAARLGEFASQVDRYIKDSEELVAEADVLVDAVNEMARTPEDLVTGIEVDAPPEVRVYVEATIRQTTDLPNR